jgi:hypothetical protein
MAAERTEAGVPSPPSVKQPPLIVRANIRGRLVRVAAMLSLAAIVFCVLVVWQRDTRLRNLALAWADDVRQLLQAHLDEHAILPLEFPDKDLIDVSLLEMRYPTADEIPRLKDKPGPYVVIAGPRRGMITPDASGCAALIYEQGKIRVEWLTRPDIEREREIRRNLVRS